MSNEDREELARILNQHDPEGGIWGDDPDSGPDLSWWYPQADAILSVGFHRTPEPEITDEMVERAALVLHGEFCLTRVYEGQGDEERIVGITPFDWLSEESRTRYRETARAALTAALGVSTPQVTEWEYGAGYEADNGIEMRWFSMGGGAFTVREAAEHEVERFSDPQIRLVRRTRPGPWEPVPTEEQNR